METLGLDPVRLRAIEGTPVPWPVDLTRVESVLHPLFAGSGAPGPAFEVEEALIDALLGPSAGPSRVRGRTPRRAATVLRRAEDQLRSVVDRPVSATELCRRVGCGRRQLEMVFHEHYGVGPIRFHRQLRMNLARRALQAEGAEWGAVTRVANAYGFTHLGRFAGAYRDLFGEEPRATARARVAPAGTPEARVTRRMTGTASGP
jgi:AraC-like DNA-binding protein